MEFVRVCRQIARFPAGAGLLVLAGLATAWPAGAATQKSTAAVLVSVVVLPPPSTCVVGASQMAYGGYLGGRTGPSSAIVVACTGPAPFQIGLAAAPAPLVQDAVLPAGPGRNGVALGRMAAGRIVAPGTIIQLIIATLTY